MCHMKGMYAVITISSLEHVYKVLMKLYNNALLIACVT